MNVDIVCAVRWGVASVGITLLDMLHPLWEKHFRCGTCAGGRFSLGGVKGKKGEVWLLQLLLQLFFKIL